MLGEILVLRDIKGVLIDLDGTIIEEQKAVVEGFLGASKEGTRYYPQIDPQDLALRARNCARALWRGFPFYSFCEQIGAGSAESLCADFEGDSDNLRALQEFKERFRVGAWSNALLEVGIEDLDLARILACRYIKERRQRFRITDETRRVLEDITGRFRVVVVTNGFSCLQREKLSISGISEIVPNVLVSGDLGIAKPEPGIFKHALEILGSRVEETVMVGDNLYNDIGGAKEFGIRGIWVSNGRGLEDKEIQPDVVISRFEEILDRI